MIQTLLFIIFFLTACSTPYGNKQKVDIDDVVSVDIQKQFDTVALRLTTEQTVDFIERWNASDSKGIYKFLPDYFLTIHFNGDSSISYRTSGELIKQRNDFSYSIGDRSYFQSMWFDRAGLASNYVEYYPVYFRNDEFTIDTNSISEKHRNAIKQVLNYYKHKWADIRGQIFYQGAIDQELLSNYTTKANDTTWLSSHK
jgi:hypothetical protein